MKHIDLQLFRKAIQETQTIFWQEIVKSFPAVKTNIFNQHMIEQMKFSYPGFGLSTFFYSDLENAVKEIHKSNNLIKLYLAPSVPFEITFEDSIYPSPEDKVYQIFPEDEFRRKVYDASDIAWQKFYDYFKDANPEGFHMDVEHELMNHDEHNVYIWLRRNS